MTKEELFTSYPHLKALYLEAGAFRVINVETGAKGRTFDEARANDLALYRPDPDYCKVQLFGGSLQVRGEIPLSVLIEKNTPREHWEIAKQVVKSNLRPCQHEVIDIYYHLDNGGKTTDEVCTDENCDRSHFCEPVKDHTYSYPVPPPTTEPGWYSLDRNLNICDVCGKEHPAGWGSLLERLRHAGGRAAPEILDADGWHTPEGKVINDLQEPLYIVRSGDEVLALSEALKIIERWREGKLSRWYVENCFYVVDAETRERLMDMNLTKATVSGALSWKPVVLTFPDAELMRKLAQLCTQVVSVAPTLGGDYFADVRDSVQVIEEPTALTNDDMPLAVLDGWLGDVCRKRMLKDYPVAYAWPALLSAASVLVTRDLLPAQTRANVYVGLIGPVGSGKTSAFNDAFRLLALRDDPSRNFNENEVCRLKAGSGEGMANAIGDQNTATKLVFVDELKHLMVKLNYQGSTFAEFLNDVFYTDVNRLVVAQRREILFSCRMSLAGGVPEEGFAETFGAGTTGGLHSRFLFGVCPSEFGGYSWHPAEGAPALERPSSEDADTFTTPRPSKIEIDPDVWIETGRWRKELRLSGRSVEVAMKAAVISAAFDNRGTLKASHLGPALALAKYQEEVHRRFEPNPGKNPEAMVAENALRYLRSRGANGQTIDRSRLLNDINAYREGPATANRALKALEENGEIEQFRAGRKRCIRLCLDRR
jgi:hypothetical protein